MRFSRGLGVAVGLLAWLDTGPTHAQALTSLTTRGRVEAMALDYGLPGHPNAVGETQLGAVLRGILVLSTDAHVALEAGLLGRVPFALDFGEASAVAPWLAIVVRPGPDDLVFRLGAFDTRHGFHPAVVDEARYAFARDYQTTYNQSLSLNDGVPRSVSRRLFLPFESGAQLTAKLLGVEFDGFLDWQLLETSAHLEKFAVGLIAKLKRKRLFVSGQLRLVHYGGERFTSSDPLRSTGVDTKRQPLTMAVTATVCPVRTSMLRIEIPATWVYGRLTQTRGAAPRPHYGFEVGLDLVFASRVRLGYRAWLPKANRAFMVSEDSEPIYRAGRSHRASLSLEHRWLGATLDARLDLVFAEGARDVQYLTVTTLRFDVEEILWNGDKDRDRDERGSGSGSESETSDTPKT